MQINIGEDEVYPDIFFSHLLEEKELSQEEFFLDNDSVNEVGSCIWQVINSIFPFVLRSFTASFLNLMVLALTIRFRFFRIFNESISDLLGGVIGFALLWMNSERFALVLPFLLYFLQSFALINFNPIRNNSNGFLCIIFTIIFIIMCQFILGMDDFLTIRGSLMIAAMKQISLSIDIVESKCITKFDFTLSHLQNFLSQFAFIFDPTTLTFGPVITYGQFRQIRWNLKQELLEHTNNFLLRLLHTLWHLFTALLFLLLSTCFIDSDTLFAFSFLPLWIIHFARALSFRCSHYFVCHFATSTALTGGASHSFEIVRWTSVEWPESLAQVASFWNIPMHSFLHKYIYCKLLSNDFVPLSASLITFLVSSMLHGFDLRMHAVLLSFGLFAVVEIDLRERLAHQLSACVRSRSCPIDGRCSHRHRSTLNPLVALPRACFLLINSYQLIYLGALIHSYGQFQWSTWIAEFRLFGHFLVLVMVFICILLNCFISQNMMIKERNENQTTNN